MDQLGRLPSPRGGGVLFGPDVTERSLALKTGIPSAFPSKMAVKSWKIPELNIELSTNEPEMADFPGFSSAMFDYQKVSGILGMTWT